MPDIPTSPNVIVFPTLLDADKRKTEPELVYKRIAYCQPCEVCGANTCMSALKEPGIYPRRSFKCVKCQKSDAQKAV